MSSLTHHASQPVAAAVWRLDRIHSSIGFEVRYMGVAPYEGSFRDVDAWIDESGLHGVAQAASVDVDDANFAEHLRAPDFFDVERFPELRFEAPQAPLDAGDVELEGRLTIKGITGPVTVTGTVSGAVDDPFGNTKLAFDLTAVVNRHDFGLSWNAPLPGGGSILGDEVTLRGKLFFVKEA